MAGRIASLQLQGIGDDQAVQSSLLAKMKLEPILPNVKTVSWEELVLTLLVRATIYGMRCVLSYREFFFGYLCGFMGAGHCLMRVSLFYLGDYVCA